MKWYKIISEHLGDQLFEIGKTKITPMSFIVFVVTIVAAIAIGRLASRAIRRYFGSKSDSQGMAYALERMVQLLAVGLGIVIGLQNVGINLSALAAVGAMLSVGIGFGLQGVAQNFISGVALLIERPVQKGDFVIIGETVGEVDQIAMRATRVVTRDSVAIIVPNNELMTGRVINMSRPDPIFRAHVKVGVAYGSDTRNVKRVLLAVAAEHEEVREKPKPDVFFKNFGDSSLDFELLVWLSDAGRESPILSDIRFAIDQAFRDEGIAIPFPQRDLHIRSGSMIRESADT